MEEVQGGELVDVAVWKRTLDGDVHLGQLFSDFLWILAMTQMGLDGRCCAPKLQIGFSIDVGCLDVANPVGVAAVENDTVCRNLLILNKIQDVSDANVFRRYLHNHLAAKNLDHLAVCNLNDHERLVQT